jgi:mannose-6-phosphate isomerase-like protein (cupin superfamily)
LSSLAEEIYHILSGKGVILLNGENYEIAAGTAIAILLGFGIK